LRSEKSHLLYLQHNKAVLSSLSNLDSLICIDIIAQHEFLVRKINNETLW